MKNTLRNGLLVSAIALLAACGGQDVVNPDDNGGFDPAASNGDGGNGAEVTTIDRGPAWQVDPLNHPDSPLQNRVIYFAFDDSSLSEEGRQLVEAHAKFLAANPSQNVVLEGHADERGTREYNIALGQQRAESVRRMMLLYGVTPAQIRVLSYGEEKPAVFGHDERSWALNRRVELRY
jgi:peptidoglycan-associated lipoprotein